MIRLEVRCCCQPTKLLGYLPCPYWQPHHGQLVPFAIVSRDWNGHVTCDRIVLPISAIWHPGGAVALAFKSEETPIETLRRIPGFIEAGRP